MPLITRLRAYTNTETRAVSPVIGIVLMVVIVVILSAVVGAFTFGLTGDQQTVPQTMIDSHDEYVMLWSERPKNVGHAGVTRTLRMNTTQVVFTHAGGESLPVTKETEIVVEGHPDAWGVVDQGHVNNGSRTTEDAVNLAPQPDFRTSDRRLTARDSWNVVTFNIHKNVGNGSAKSLYRRGEHDVEPPAVNDDDYLFWQSFSADSPPYQCDCSVVYFGANYASPDPEDGSGGWGTRYGWGQQLEPGQEAQVVWAPDGGGESHILHEHTVRKEETNESNYD